jgi:hypothetical protein
LAAALIALLLPEFGLRELVVVELVELGLVVLGLVLLKLVLLKLVALGYLMLEVVLLELLGPDCASSWSASTGAFPADNSNIQLAMYFSECSFLLLKIPDEIFFTIMLLFSKDHLSRVNFFFLSISDPLLVGLSSYCPS